MKYSSEEKEELCTLIFAELKGLGVKIPKVKKIKSGVKQERNAIELKTKIFGISLLEQEWVSEDGNTLPRFLADSTAYLGKYTKVEIGLFRKAGSVARQRDLRIKLENGGNLDGAEPNDVASLMKQWLRELPEPIIPCCLHDLFVKCQNLEAEDVRLTAILLCCFLLPVEHLSTLKHLILFLYDIAANSEVNKMVPHNLAVIMAPNLLSAACDRTGCKSGSDLVPCYTSIVELLILNAKKVGEIPSGISSKLSVKLEEFDFSVDALDCSPSKSKKKRRSGGVIDIMSGIRRLVGGNLTPVTNFLELSDDTQPGIKMNTACTSGSRSAPKRKADPALYTLSGVVKKRAVLNTESERTFPTSLLTPIGKTARFVNSLATPITGSTPTGRSRRKSFGLLKKKQQKKIKSKVSAAPKQISPLLPPVNNHLCGENEQCKSVCQVQGHSAKVMDSLVIPKIIEISPLIISYTVSPVLRGEKPFMKRTYSDCLKSVQQENCSTKFISVSHDDLSHKMLSPTLLKSGTPAKQHLSRKECHNEKFGKKLVSPCIKGSKSPKIGNHLNPRILHNYSSVKSSIRHSNSLRRNSFKSTCLNQVKSDSALPNLPPKCKLFMSEENDSTITKNFVSLQSQNLSKIITLTEQANEAAEKLNRSLKYKAEVEISKTVEVSVEFKTPSIKNNQGKIYDYKPCSSSVKRHGLKKNANKSSLKRGRPNTVKTGLPLDLCPKYSSDSILSSSSFDVRSSHKKNNVENCLNEGLSVMEDNVFDDIEIKKSLNSEMDACVKEMEENINFCDMSVNNWLNSTPLESKRFDKSISFRTTKSFEAESSISVTDSCSKQAMCSKISADKNFEKNPIHRNSYSKTRRSSSLSKTGSYENLFAKRNVDKKSKKFSSSNVNFLTPSPAMNNMKFEVIVDELKNLSSEKSEKDNTETCVSAEKSEKDKETWVSAEKFFKTYLQPSTPVENQACKRESIVQLMIRNAGKVQASVKHYNYICDSLPHKPSEIPCTVSDFKSTGLSTSNSTNNRSVSFQEKTPSSCNKSKSEGSENRSLRRRQQSLSVKNDSNSELHMDRFYPSLKLHRSPVPPPPKFLMNSDVFTSVYPLKEVTNLSITNECFPKISQTCTPVDSFKNSPVKRSRSLKNDPFNGNISIGHAKKHIKYSSPASN